MGIKKEPPEESKEIKIEPTDDDGMEAEPDEITECIEADVEDHKTIKKIDQQWNLKRDTTYKINIKSCPSPYTFVGVNHTHSDHARTPINGVGTRSKKILLKEKQCFDVFKGQTEGKKVTVST